MNLHQTNSNFFVTLILLSLQFNIYAQGWERVFYRPDEKFAQANNLLAIPDGSFLLLSSYLEGNSTLISGARIIRIDEEGNTLWEREIEDYTYRKAYLREDGNITLLGKLINSTDNISIRVIDLLGETVENYDFSGIPDFPGSLGSLKQEMVMASNGDFLIGGRYTPPFEKADSAIVVRLDQQANFIDSYTVKLQEYDAARFHRGIIPTNDNGFIASVNVFNNFERITAYLVKYDQNGNIVWQTEHERYDLSIGIGDNFYGTWGSRIVEFDPQGKELRGRSFTSRIKNSGLPERGIPLSDGGVLAYGSNRPILDVEEDFFLARLDASFEPVFINRFGKLAVEEDALSIVETQDQGFALFGKTEALRDLISDQNMEDLIFIKLDSLGNGINNYIEGNIYHDEEEDCIIEPDGPRLNNFYVRAQDENTVFYGRVDESGYYSIKANIGEYDVSVIRPNIYWEACDSVVETRLERLLDTIHVDHQMQIRYECPLMKVDVSTPLLQRCKDNTYRIRYWNEGTTMAEDAKIAVAFDTFFTINSSFPAWDEKNGQQLSFNIGEVAFGEGGFIDVNVTLDCEVLEGQSHCVEVHAAPDTLCTPPGINWDGSSLEVSGQCLGDSVEFIIRNVGDPMQQPAQFIVVEDNIIYFGGNVQLGTGEQERIVTFASGNTFRIEVEQSPGHPGDSNPIAVVEGCIAEEETPSLGFVITNPFDEGDPFIAIDCQENVVIAEPNEIQGFPTGTGEDNLIEPNTDIEYKIRFQNTEFDMVDTLVIDDILPPGLDITSVQPGASSHDYIFDVTAEGMLKFTFPNIMLPNSNTDEVASHGFVQFKVSQMEHLLPGTVLRNKAVLYFDSEDPVVTNTGFHTISKPKVIKVIERGECSRDIDAPVIGMMGVDTISFPTYDSIVVWNEVTYPEHFIEFDTIFNDGTEIFSEHLKNQYGCDSIVVYRDTSTVATQYQYIDEQSVILYPNPVSQGKINLAFELRESTVVQIELFNAFGQRLDLLQPAKSSSVGRQQFQFEKADMPSGIYWLQIRAGQDQITKRLIYR